MKAKVIVGEAEGYPPMNSVGNCEKIDEKRSLFFPENDADLPPGCPRKDFGGYEMAVEELQLL